MKKIMNLSLLFALTMGLSLFAGKPTESRKRETSDVDAFYDNGQRRSRRVDVEQPANNSWLPSLRNLFRFGQAEPTVPEQTIIFPVELVQPFEVAPVADPVISEQVITGPVEIVESGSVVPTQESEIALVSTPIQDSRIEQSAAPIAVESQNQQPTPAADEGHFVRSASPELNLSVDAEAVVLPSQQRAAVIPSSVAHVSYRQEFIDAVVEATQPIRAAVDLGRAENTNRFNDLDTQVIELKGQILALEGTVVDLTTKLETQNTLTIDGFDSVKKDLEAVNQNIALVNSNTISIINRSFAIAAVVGCASYFIMPELPIIGPVLRPVVPLATSAIAYEALSYLKSLQRGINTVKRYFNWL